MIELREQEAWEARYRHGKAARAWAAIAEDHRGGDRKPTLAECLILAEWMAAYEEADAKAEEAFRELRRRASQAPTESGDRDG